MKALACAGYDYMKLMVSELQRQLDDIEGRERNFYFVDYLIEGLYFFFNIENPVPLAQAVGSPIPPPRQRYNPFNRSDGSVHQRSHSMRSAPSSKFNSKKKLPRKFKIKI